MSDYDDFYGEDENSSFNQEYLPNKESDRELKKITPIGYQDGLEIGKEITLQKGFNDGFKEGADTGYKWSLLIGLISSIDVFYHQNKNLNSNTTAITKLDDLVNRLNIIVKDKTSPPSIELLKSKFKSYKVDGEEEFEREGNCMNNTISTSADNNSGCCGGSGSRGSTTCCKEESKLNINSITTPKIEKKTVEFDTVCRECEDIITELGLDGKTMIKNLLSKSLNVITN
ncbi:hypothetical protein DLAC_04156 [Tieghemostelium lacteum]|uniref:Essential protein Yae1 N-terminal domain-containing protein n=1 Tax=Tieghemostelium lacteum TaxID=361077 RepID=A0A151ZSE2_TIELA|nr:hypothetical protein DLAC_04156 [Tieghemostelium lacteum]|eukprot:KYQ96850.1 hypothetical protein DLAC_04156 [Tieghemostelium lacteum]